MLLTPDTNFMSTVNSNLYKFIWNNKKNGKIKRMIMNQDLDIGGYEDRYKSPKQMSKVNMDSMHATK